MSECVCGLDDDFGLGTRDTDLLDARGGRKKERTREERRGEEETATAAAAASFVGEIAFSWRFRSTDP